MTPTEQFAEWRRAHEHVGTIRHFGWQENVTMIEEKHGSGRGRAGRHHGTHRGDAGEFSSPHAIRLILTPVDETSEGGIRLSLAAHLARSMDADLVGIGLASSSAPGSDIERAPHHTADGEMSPTRRIFADTMANAGIDYYWRESHPEGHDDVTAWAKLADLVVVGQLADATPRRFRADHLGLECGRPILVLPPKPPTNAIGSNVVIAWDGSREAVRALHDAMPLMRDAARISIVECEADLTRTSQHPNAQAAQLVLERHGFQAFSDVEILGSESVADLLLECVHHRSADLLVAGLYHHSRLREYIFGGASRELLHRCPIALLVSH
jgi:nucleotide-binding universal stress UspA family protein